MRIENREVTWKVLDIPLYGTITEPTDKRAHAAVVFVAGSGPTDRDWCSPLLPGTNGSGKLLAELLARNGFLTIRYDKLASGLHAQENFPRFVGRLSMQTHVDELRGAVETMLSEKKVPKDNLFVLTNSEGAIHAINYQLQEKSNRFRGLVLTGPPGRSIGDVGRWQIFKQVKSLPDAETIMKHYDEAMAAFMANNSVVIDPSLPEGLQQLIASLMTPANLPFARELWTYRLPEHITHVNEPLLVMIGKKDLQIDWKIDGGLLEKATSGNSFASFVYPKNANHVLKHEELPLEKLVGQSVGLRYNAPDAELDEEAARAISDWLDEQSTGT
jgi:pimeloyl-ACP methyl ester carboxylesterase